MLHECNHFTKRNMYRIICVILGLLRCLDANKSCVDHPCDCCKNRECTKQDEDHFTCDGCTDGLTGLKCTFRCPVNCYNCSQKYFDNDRFCEVCKEGYYNGRYLDRDDFGVRNDCSLSCKEECSFCTAYNYCTECKAGYFISVDHDCVPCAKHCELCEAANHCAKCILGYFWDGTACQKCSSDCRTCFSYDICSSCGTGFYLKKHKCSMCTSGCASCNDSSTCHNCEKRYYLREDRCVKCSDFCAECLADGICTECEKDFKLVNRTCQRCKSRCEDCVSYDNCTKCQDGFYDVNGECNACSSNCAKCSSDDMCEGCLDGFYGPLCSLKCATNCRSCRKDNGQCLVCKTGSHLNRNGQCVTCLERCIICESEQWCDQCEDGFQGRTCRCPKHCVCDSEDICVSCEDGYTGEICELQCSSGCSGNLCSKQTGECLNGCRAGYVDKHCLKENGQPDGDDSSGQLTFHSVLVLVGTILAIVSFIIACLVGIFICRRRSAFRGEMIQKELTTLQRKGTRASAQSDLIEFDEYREPSVSNTSERGKLAKSRGRIPLPDFTEYVLRKTRAEFMEEFKNLPRGLTKPYKESQKKVNIRKNRYMGVYPYDDTRVVLKSGNSNYINASYIDGFKGRKTYIASIGPSKTYMDDMSAFWRMVWQEKCSKIVMLCNLTEPKVNTCDQYWPDRDYFMCYGEITISSLTEEVHNNYTVRSFEMQLNSERRIVTHFQITSWPEDSVPTETSSLVSFRQEVNKTPMEMEGPIVVHCSAGVGRTGTFIALDILTQEGDAEGHVDVFSCVSRLREQRSKMVQTVEQYEYLHKALVSSLNYYLNVPSTSAARPESSASVNYYVEINPYTQPS